MTTKYLLPCSCGQKLPIEISQAGQIIRCQCGRDVESPTMLGIRQLEPALSGDEEARPHSWSAWRGLPFAFGVLTAVVALAAAGFLTTKLPHVETADVLPEADAVADSRIDALPIDELWTTWLAVSATPLAEQTPPEHVQARRVWRKMIEWIVLLLAVATLGVSVAAGAILWKPRRGRALARSSKAA